MGSKAYKTCAAAISLYIGYLILAALGTLSFPASTSGIDADSVWLHRSGRGTR